MSIELVMPSNYLILCHPLLLLASLFPSIRVFSSDSVLCIRWPNDWSFSFSISPSNEYSELISFRMDWLDLLAVQGTLKSLLQHHSSKPSILWCSAFFMVQFSHLYGNLLAKWCLLFNTLSRLIIAFLPRSKRLFNAVKKISGQWERALKEAMERHSELAKGFMKARLEKVSFHSNPKERQWQRMLKLPHDCTHLTR